MNPSTSNDSMRFRSQLEIKESEEMYRYLDKRITDVEKSFGILTPEFIGFARRTAKLRNNGDKMINLLIEYVNNQRYNSSTNESIKAFCQTMSVIEDLRNIEFSRIKDHVIIPMIGYNGALKTVKNNVKKDMAAHRKELISTKKFDKGRTGGGTSQTQTLSNTDVSVVDASRLSEKIMKTVTDFERKKLEHMQSLLKSFIHIEMLWHMRALERYSEAFGPLKSIDSQGDLDEFLEDLRNFRAHDHMRRSNSNLHLTDRRSQSMSNLQTTKASSQGDISGRNELRSSVTFEDQLQRSKSYQQTPPHPLVYAKSSANDGRLDSQTELNGSKPPRAIVPPKPVIQKANNDESEYTDSDDYTYDGTTSPTRTTSARSTNRAHGNQPMAQKRGR